MITENKIAIAILVSVVTIAFIGFLLARWFIKKAKKQTESLKPMIEDYLSIMCKLDNISQSHELETVDFCIKIFKDAYSDIPGGDNYLEEMNQLYKIKELEIDVRGKQQSVPFENL